VVVESADDGTLAVDTAEEGLLVVHCGILIGHNHLAIMEDRQSQVD